MAKEEVKKGEEPKMSYEQLMKAAQDLNAQNNYLKNQVTTLQKNVVELSDFTMFKRLDYLFEVVKNADKFPADFVANCTKEIMETMTPPVEEENKNEQ